MKTSEILFENSLGVFELLFGKLKVGMVAQRETLDNMKLNAASYITGTLARVALVCKILQ